VMGRQSPYGGRAMPVMAFLAGSARARPGKIAARMGRNGQAAPRRMARAAASGSSRLWSWPWRAAAGGAEGEAAQAVAVRVALPASGAGAYGPGGGGFAAGDGDRPGGLTSRLADGALLTSHLGGWLTGRLGGASQLA